MQAEKAKETTEVASTSHKTKTWEKNNAFKFK